MDDAYLGAEMARELRLLDDQHRAAARQDPNAFVTYVMRDDETGLPILQNRWHFEWQAIWSKYRRSIIWSHPEGGKTVQVSGRILFELGLNPRLRIGVLSNTFDQAKKITSPVAKYIESSAELKRVFPHLRPDTVTGWSVSEMFIDRPNKFTKDPTLRPFGIHANILGGRIDLLIIDDVLDHENTRTHAQREDLRQWILSTIEGRLTKEARVWWIGNAWHRDDAMHTFAKHVSWNGFKYPVVDKMGKTVWADKWPQDRVDQKRVDLGPLEFMRQMGCQARSDEDARFKEAWIEGCKKRGNMVDMVHALHDVPPGHRIFTGVDLGVREKSAARKRKRPDYTCLFTIAVLPDESRRVLEVQSGNWGGQEIVNRIIDVHRRLHSIVVVENNAAQDFILQFARGQSSVPLIPFTTGSNKHHPEFGIESMAVEMSNAKWIIPNIEGLMEPDIAAWVDEMLYYDPLAHTGDRLMASWFAREGGRLQPKPPGRVQTRRIDLMSR